MPFVRAARRHRGGRLRRYAGAVLAGLALLGVVSAAAADVAVPALERRVTDLTGTLSAAQQQTLEDTLAAFEASKGSQIAVLIVPTTQPETREQYAIRVFDAWKLGRKGVDDGALLLIAKNDRNVYIQTGYGLEGPLPDVTAHRIVEEDIIPRFKTGDYFGGIQAGITRMITVIDGEPLPPPPEGRTHARGSGFESFLVPALIAVFVLGGIARAVFGRFAGAGIMGALAAGIAWFISGALLVALIAGVIAFVTVLLGGFGGLPGGGFGGGGFGGGGGFSGGGGGFSGGGGSSGGGGAGGSW